MSTYLVNTSSQLVDDVVNNVIKSTRLPASQITYSTLDIINFLNDEQQVTIESLIKKVREDFWLSLNDQQITTGQYNYSMPVRSIGGSLRNFVFVDMSGFEIQLPHLDPDQIMVPSYFSFRPSWQGQGAYLQNDQVYLWPTTWNNTSYKLRQKYERRPNALTSYSNCSQIVSVNPSLNQLGFNASTPFSAGQLVDIISNQGQFPSQGDDMLISSVNGSVLTFDTSTPITTSIKIGSWVCPDGLTCVPQIPNEAYALLAARGSLRIAAGLQNSNLFNVTSKLAEDSASKIMDLITPRVSGNPRKFVNKNVIGGPYSFPYYR